MTDMTIGIIGSGNIGAGLARLTTAAGLRTLISNSRGPDTLQNLVTELGMGVSARTPEQVAREADLVVLALPLAAYVSLPIGALSGRVVVDAMNHYPRYTGLLPALDESGLTSSEFVQAALPDARLVKALNNIDYLRLTRLPRPTNSPDRSALPIAGNSAEAKALTEQFLDAIGFDAFDLGALSEGWRSQPGTPIYVSPYTLYLPDASSDPRVRFMESGTVPVSTERAKILARPLPADRFLTATLYSSPPPIP